MQGRRVAVIQSGGNIDSDQFVAALATPNRTARD
jgi:hypothetical protein